jgi:signal transduction protein with GAF and PtsI domain
MITGSPPVYGERLDLRRVAPEVPASVEAAIRDGLELLPARRTPSIAEFARALEVDFTGTPGRDLALSVARTSAPRRLLQGIVRTAAGIFEAAASSVALVAPSGKELVFEAAWGAGADEIVGERLEAGTGIAGVVVQDGRPTAVPDCRSDPRFAARFAERTGHVPYTMLAVPLVSGARTIGVLSLLDRRDGTPYTLDDVPRAELLAELAVVAIESEGALPRTPADATETV